MRLISSNPRPPKKRNTIFTELTSPSAKGFVQGLSRKDRRLRADGGTNSSGGREPGGTRFFAVLRRSELQHRCAAVARQARAGRIGGRPAKRRRPLLWPRSRALPGASASAPAPLEVARRSAALRRSSPRRTRRDLQLRGRLGGIASSRASSALVAPVFLGRGDATAVPLGLGAVGSLILVLYGSVPCAQPIADGRPYGRSGFFVALSVAWARAFDGFKPDVGDFIGCAIALIGAGVIVFYPRQGGGVEPGSSAVFPNARERRVRRCIKPHRSLRTYHNARALSRRRKREVSWLFRRRP